MTQLTVYEKGDKARFIFIPGALFMEVQATLAVVGNTCFLPGE
ncbi:MAG: hypothetical protein AAF685_14015 [Cyanobacteria bacterium P01_C01_bin.89]